MEESKQPERGEQPHDRRDRARANDRPKKRRDYAAGADGEQDVTAGPSEAEDLFRPDRDGSGS